jgi:dipeptidase D
LGTAAKIESVAALAGARYEALSGYPGWKPNMQSPLLFRAKNIWVDVHRSTPKIEVIHAGLECGIIGETLPGMDMISLGPTIENPHSPTERVSISSVERFYDFVKAFVGELGRG